MQYIDCGTDSIISDYDDTTQTQQYLLLTSHHTAACLVGHLGSPAWPSAGCRVALSVYNRQSVLEILYTVSSKHC